MVGTVAGTMSRTGAETVVGTAMGINLKKAQELGQGSVGEFDTLRSCRVFVVSTLWLELTLDDK